MKNTSKVKKTLTAVISGIMMMTTAASFAVSADDTGASENSFEHFNDYRSWAENVGYNSGYLTQAGVKGN